MSFLTIPSQEGIFTTVKADKSPEDDDDEDEVDDTDEVCFIKRGSSPVPRRRGQSIHDETAEYMRIHLSLPAVLRRVSFADTTGGDLTDVKEFVAFDSDEEEDARFEAEGARYRKQSKEPTYHIKAEFDLCKESALADAVKTNKVEVELLSPVENEPLAFSGIVRVLNISYHKAVYIRATMDSWTSYYDYPAEYVPESNDAGTDQFCFKLSFSPPYDTHGSCIEFVVRYETSDGDYWANNSHMNYVVMLLVSYDEDDLTRVNTDLSKIRGILKPPKVYSITNDYEEHMDAEGPSAAHSDLETADDHYGAPTPANPELQSLAESQNPASMPLKMFCTSSDNKTDGGSTRKLSQKPPSNESQSLSALPCELENQTLDRQKDNSHFAPQPAASPILQLTPTQPAASPILQVTPPQPAASPILQVTPPCGPSLVAGDREQEEESSVLNEMNPFTAAFPSTTEANLHSEIDEEKLLHMTLESKMVKVTQVSLLEESCVHQIVEETVQESEEQNVSISTPDNTISSTKEHFESELNEGQAESSLPSELSLDKIVGNPTYLKKEETLHADPLVSLNNAGITDCPCPSNMSPISFLMLGEQSPDVSAKTNFNTKNEEPSTASLSIQPFETPNPSLTIELVNVRKEVDSGKQNPHLKQSELISTDREEPDLSVQVSILRSHKEDHSDTMLKTKNDKAFEEQAILGDTGAEFIESSEKAIQAKARTDDYKTTGKEAFFSGESTNEESTHAPISTAAINTAVKNQSISLSSSEETMDDTADIFGQRDALDLLEETSPQLDNPMVGEEEITGLVSSRVCTTESELVFAGDSGLSHSGTLQPVPKFPPNYGSFPTVVAVSSSELTTMPSVDATSFPQHDEHSTTPAPLVPKAESEVFLGEKRHAATSISVAGNILEITDVDAIDTIQDKKKVEESSQISPDTLLENQSNTLSEAAMALSLHPESNVGRKFRLSIIFLCGSLFLFSVLHEPSTLFFLGLALVTLLSFVGK